MRHLMLVAALLPFSACHGNDPAKGGAGSATTPQTTPSNVGSPKPDPAAAGSAVVAADKPPVVDAKPAAPPAPPAPPALEGHDFTAMGRELFAIGACGEVATPEGYSAQMIAKHCKVIRAAQEDYANQWVKLARPFFAEKVPANVPKRVVYPFAGGDLSTALTVYPDADEITTMSLEPAGDPRTLDALNRAANARVVGKSAKPSEPRSSAALDRALGTVEKELRFLYRVNFSNTLNMIDAMRGGALPTQLIFGLSALKVHGYELVSLRYFTLDEAGTIHYLSDDEVAAAPDATSEQKEKRNRIFANAEVRFQKPGGRVQIYRHIQQNLDNDHLKADPRVIKHLEAKGTVAAMTKAASYLLSWESFSIMRDYLMGHVTWMVSDATGIAPKWGKAAGFEYETYGGFTEPHIPAGNDIARSWRTEFAVQPKRELKFRFGYYDKRIVDHLIIMMKKS
ncbi:MAG: hypothetical protein H6Q90_621 [Deltaproteobacteria bacterium]|nr:hypothetical protein [Deltaproteobacteria bacterium]